MGVAKGESLAIDCTIFNAADTVASWPDVSPLLGETIKKTLESKWKNMVPVIGIAGAIYDAHEMANSDGVFTAEEKSCGA